MLGQFITVLILCRHRYEFCTNNWNCILERKRESINSENGHEIYLIALFPRIIGNDTKIVAESFNHVYKHFIESFSLFFFSSWFCLHLFIYARIHCYWAWNILCVLNSSKHLNAIVFFIALLYFDGPWQFHGAHCTRMENISECYKERKWRKKMTRKNTHFIICSVAYWYSLASRNIKSYFQLTIKSFGTVALKIWFSVLLWYLQFLSEIQNMI